MKKRILNIYILLAILMKVKKREEQISLVTSNKTEKKHTENCALQIRLTSNLMIHYEKHTGWMGRDFSVSLFDCMFA